MSNANSSVLQDYEIQERDILKIGRVKFAVKEIGYATDSQKMEVDQSNLRERGHSANSIHTTAKDDEFEEFEEVTAIMNADPEIESDEKKCRFCWTSGACEENPLLGSCKCAGSVGFIHLKCLCSWLEVKRQAKTSQNFSTFFWKSFECEICKNAYPLMFKVCGRTYNLV